MFAAYNLRLETDFYFACGTLLNKPTKETPKPDDKSETPNDKANVQNSEDKSVVKSQEKKSKHPLVLNAISVSSNVIIPVPKELFEDDEGDETSGIVSPKKQIPSPKQSFKS